MIPKILFQTSIEPQSKVYVTKLMSLLGSDWVYKHFTDDDVLRFFERHTIPEFPKISDCFLKLTGAHRADIFRLYFLIVHGGVYMEADAMLVDDSLDNMLDGKELVTILGVDKKTIFPGILAATKNHPAIVEALRMAVVAPLEDWEANYFLSCQHLSHVLNKHVNKPTVSILTESGTPDPTEFASYDKKGRPFLMHFPLTKKIPDRLL